MTELPIVVNMTVDASRTEYDLTAESNLEEIELLNDTVIETGGSHVPVYEGPYTVDAGLNAVTLDTDGKRMTQDVTVNALTENSVSMTDFTVAANTGIAAITSTVTRGYSATAKSTTTTVQLPTQARATITPTASEQTAVAKGKYTTGVVKVRAISSPYADVSGVTATAGDVLSGKYFVDSSGVLTLGTGGGGMNTETKDALLECFEHVAWADSDGQIYYNNLLNALYPLQSISAVYTQSGDVYADTPLNDLKNDLVVTATFEDGTVKTVTNYTLSGTLTVGTSAVTVTYFTETTTFNVTVSDEPVEGIVIESGKTASSTTGALGVNASRSVSEVITLDFSVQHTVVFKLNNTAVNISLRIYDPNGLCKNSVAFATSQTIAANTLYNGFRFVVQQAITNETMTLLIDNEEVPVVLGTVQEYSNDINVVTTINGINSSTGEITTNSARLATAFIPVVKNDDVNMTWTVVAPNNIYIKIFEYSNTSFFSNYYIGDLASNTASGSKYGDCTRVRILLKKSDNSDFTSAEISTITLVNNGMVTYHLTEA